LYSWSLHLTENEKEVKSIETQEAELIKICMKKSKVTHFGATEQVILPC
jgi:hypothetical protein